MTARIGLVGAGGIGRAHAQAVSTLDGAVLAGVCDVDAVTARVVAAEHETVALGLTELADPDRCDLVVVATPPATHPDLVAPFLAAGVPVLCEKPIAIGAAAAERMVDAAERTGTPLTMATKFRFVEEVRRARELLADGLLGELVKIEVSFAGRVEMAGRWNCDPEIAGGGVLIDNATHGVDLVRHLAGPIVEVFAVPGPATQGLRVEDSATLLARTEGGALAQVDVTWSFRRLSPVYCGVYGTAGSVEIGWQGARAVTTDVAGEYVFGSGYRKIDSLRDNLAGVIAALAAGQTPPVTVEDMVAAAAVIDAGYASAKQACWIEVTA
jgi:predicted dehydrogenase